MPAPLYARMLDLWPAQELFATTNAMRRRELWLREHWNDLQGAQGQTWRLVARVLRYVNPVIFKRFEVYLSSKFMPYLGKSWRDHVKKLPLIMSGVQLASYRGTIGLPPHVDHARIVTNAFLYCNERPQAEAEQATVLYRSLGLALPTNMNIDGADLSRHMRVAEIVPYQPNLCLAFLNTPRSFHGVDSRDIGERERRLVIFNSSVKSSDAVRLFGEAAAQA